MRCDEWEAPQAPAGAAFENRSGAAFEGREHRKRRKTRRTTTTVAFSNSLSGIQRVCRGCLNMAPTNKVHHVHTIARVAEMLGEDWLWDVANEMDQEDGLIWVYGPGDAGENGVMAFTDFGIETLTALIEIYKETCVRMSSRR